jgi:hypothetical protein
MDNTNEKNNHPEAHERPHYSWMGLILVSPVLPLAILSFWAVHGLDNLLYRLLRINTTNALILILLYAIAKIVVGFWLGLIYIPRKIVKFDTLIILLQSHSRIFWRDKMRTALGITLFGCLIGVGFLGLMDFFTILALQFLK